MVTKISFKSNLWLRHCIVAIPSLLFFALFWFTRMEWDPEMRFWRAIGDASLLLLWLVLMIGPLSRVWLAARALLSWRREIGIWCGILGVAHGVLILNGWVRWDISVFFGYEFIPQLDRLARIEPGFGLANVLGMLAFFWLLVLTATSSDWAMNRLGSAAWKWLHNGAYIVFYLIVAHTFYFLFMHYTASFHRNVPTSSNWFQIPFVLLALSVPILQVIGFLNTINARKQTKVKL